MNQDVKTISLKIGRYQAKAVPTGIFGLDGGSMFGTVPKVLWEKTNPPDEQNRIAMEARALLLMDSEISDVRGRQAKRNILVDCGVGTDFVAKYGEKLGPKFAQMYAIDRSTTSLEKSLSKQGLSVSDITDVILTHLHFDHAGGATCEDASGKLVPTFPNAQYYVQRRNYETACHPNVREKASYFASNFQPLMDAGVLQLLDGDVENLLPGISVIVSDGHTQGQQMVHVHDLGEMNLVYCGDVIPTSTHVRLPWIMGYDLHPLMLIEEKRRMLTKAAAGKWWLYFEHDPYFDVAQVEAVKDDFAVRERCHI